MARGMNERIQKLRELSVTTPVHIEDRKSVGRERVF